MHDEKEITLKHVAGKLNVSIATMPKALNDRHYIGVKSKGKMQEYVKESIYAKMHEIVNYFRCID